MEDLLSLNERLVNTRINLLGMKDLTYSIILLLHIYIENKWVGMVHLRKKDLF